MPSAEALIYDFETVIAAAVANAFTKAGFTAALYTAQSAEEDQKKRPRVEVQFIYGGEEMPIRFSNDGTWRAQAFVGELKIMALTDTTPAAKVTHGDYRAKVRSFCHTLLPRVNNVTGGLQYHQIMAIIESGTTQYFEAKNKGHEASSMTFAVRFCINAQGLQTLSAPQVNVSNDGNTPSVH